MLKPILNSFKKYQQYIFSCLFIISTPFLTWLFSSSLRLKYLIVGMALSLLITLTVIWLNYKDKFRNWKWSRSDWVIMIFSLLVAKIYVGYFATNQELFFKFFGPGLTSYNLRLLRYSVAFLALPALFIYSKLITDRILVYTQEFLSRLNNKERYFLVATLLVGLVVSAVVHNLTSVWRNPGGDSCLYDVIYTSDSSCFDGDAVFTKFSMAENDFRQPLFAVFSLPFSVLAKILARIIFFLPHGYDVFMTAFQLGLLAIILVMLSHLALLKTKDQIPFLVFGMGTFAFVSFWFLKEQYVFATFYLIVAIYFNVQTKISADLLYVPAVGSLLTSAGLYPFTGKFVSLTDFLKRSIKSVAVFFSYAIITGQYYYLVHLLSGAKRLGSSFGGVELDFLIKLKQYTYFVRSIFLAPASQVVNLPTGVKAYHLISVEKFSLVGIVILGLVILSLWLHRRQQMAWICGIWVLISAILLVKLGWGAKENGMTLYILYFSFGFLVPIFWLIRRIKFAWLRWGMIVTMIAFNLVGLLKIMKFGIIYYQ